MTSNTFVIGTLNTNADDRTVSITFNDEYSACSAWLMLCAHTTSRWCYTGISMFTDYDFDYESDMVTELIKITDTVEDDMDEDLINDDMISETPILLKFYMAPREQQKLFNII